jgi:hypothetical protein
VKTRIHKVKDVFIVSFKKPRSGRLLNIEACTTAGLFHACKIARRMVEEQRPGEGWREYGAAQATRVEGLHVYYGANGRTEEWHPLVRVRGKWMTTQGWHYVKIDKEVA